MKSLRRSLNSDKASAGPGGFTPSGGGPSSSSSSGGASSSSLPLNGAGGGARMPLPVSTTAPGGKVLPPQKVIKALTTHKSDSPLALSYAKGDFFFLTGEIQGDERNPAGWYQALNPISGSRGRVPRDHFEEFNKGGRATSGSVSGGGGQGARPHSPLGSATSSPYSATAGQDQHPPSSAPVTMGPRVGGPAPAAQSMSRASSGTSGSQPKKAANPLYAIVQYDFEAERPDELDARAGEPIIVIAQSNHEWFVAKPIGRLGGPGLIPVSFVEIRDPNTGKSVENVQELLAGGSIPPVEEWKKSTAEYKAASIPLGKFDFGPSGGAGAGAAVAGMAGSTGPGQRGTSGSYGQPQQRGSNQGGAYSAPATRDQRANGPSGVAQDSRLRNGEIVAANVVSFHYEDNKFWFRINATFLADRRASSNGEAKSLVLYRLYDDFYNFQITLLDLFPREAGRGDAATGNPTERILPFMPGPLDEVNVEITSARREDLDTYLNELVALRSHADYILQDDHVLDFFSPNVGDQVIRISRDEALAKMDQQASTRPVEDQMANMRMGEDDSRYQSRQSRDREQDFFGRGPSRTSGNGRGTPSTQTSSRGDSPLPTNGSDPHRPGSARASGTAQPTAMFSPGMSTGTATTASWGSNAGPGNASIPGREIRTSGSNAPPVSATAPQAAFIKIKVLDRTTDDMIAIRVPPRVTFAQLLDKVRDRLGPNVSTLQYRRQGGSFTDLFGDDGLAEWLRAEEKLVLYAQ